MITATLVHNAFMAWITSFLHSDDDKGETGTS
jgi:hypothetical protein